MRILLLALSALMWCSAIAAKPAPVVYSPSGASGKLPVAVWLHGYRNFPGALSDAEYYQAIAQQLKIAIVGIPGTATLDDETLQWSEEPVADHAYVQSVLAELAARHSLDLNRVALFGFSQGAMVAGDLSLLFPSSYRGALLFSPGGMTTPHFPKSRKAEHARQVYISVCGAGEHAGNVEWTKAYAAAAKEVTEKVELKLYPGMKEHTRPPDFKVRFPVWIGSILDVPTKG
jgi:pimeloyl-ACP methyl ester carboxylesterase